MSSILTFCQWLEATSISVGIRESTWTYPIIESVHVLSLCLFFGLILFWDLRLMGARVMHDVAVSEIWNRLIPWIATGFILSAISGSLLFVSDPVRFYGNIFFRIKAVALVLAGLNALAFHYGIEKKLVQWDTSPSTPPAAKVAGFVSMLMWVLVVVCGRFIAYNWFDPLV